LASVAVSNISSINYNQSNINISGFNIEHYRIAAGQAPGDTAVVPNSNTPTRQRTLIKGVIGPVTNNCDPTAPAATVTVTLGPTTSAATATIGQVDFLVIWGE
jgi:hypothetical protein